MSPHLLTTFDLWELGLTCLLAGFVLGLLMLRLALARVAAAVADQRRAIGEMLLALTLLELRLRHPPTARLQLEIVHRGPPEGPLPGDEWKHGN